MTMTRSLRLQGDRKRPFHAFAKARQGLAAVEFAFALPLLLLILLGFYELDRYVETTRQLENAANSVSQMLTQTTKDQLTRGDLNLAYDSLMVLVPRVLQDSARKGHKWRDDITVSMSSVAFTNTTPGCTADCVYSARIAWSGGSSKRPCNTSLEAVDNDLTPSPATLPADAFGPNGIIVVDLAYDYTPLMANKLFPSFAIKRSSYLQPRYLPPASQLNYAVAGGDDLVTTC
jgi:Flp pilus assembly protein TadG